MKKFIALLLFTALGAQLVNQTNTFHEATTTSIKKVASVSPTKFKPVQASQIAISNAYKAPVAIIKPQMVQVSSGNVEDIVRAAARKYGINEDYFAHIAKCESTFNPNAVNHSYFDNGYPSGLFQHISGYWPARAAKYGYAGASVFDATAQANVTAQMFRDGQSRLWECK